MAFADVICDRLNQTRIGMRMKISVFLFYISGLELHLMRNEKLMSVWAAMENKFSHQLSALEAEKETNCDGS